MAASRRMAAELIVALQDRAGKGDAATNVFGWQQVQTMPLQASKAKPTNVQRRPAAQRRARIRDRVRRIRYDVLMTHATQVAASTLRMSPDE